MPARLPVVLLVLLLIVASALYLTRLSFAPPYLMHDEINFSLQAHAIGTTARDTNGRLFPVYFSETGFEAGRDPVMIYWTALLMAVRPLSEVTARFPTALLAVLTIGLTFALGRRMWRSDWLGLAAATMLALTPGYFTNARLAMSITYPIPIIIVWLYCVSRAFDTPSSRWVVAAGATLGLGIYTYLASVVMMPLLLALTMVMLIREQRQRDLLPLLIGCGVLLLPLGAWLIAHPDRLSNLVTSYRPEGLTTAIGMRERVTAFWMFFNPDYLFISGDARLTNSTRIAGLFPLACAMLIPVGLYRLIRSRQPIALLVAAGFFLSPIAGALSGRLEINRVLFAIPFGVLAAAAGLRHLGSQGTALKSIAAVLAVSIFVQFSGFYRHYGGPYRVAAAPWFGGDNRTALNAVLDRVTETTPQIYLNGRTPIERYWRFYAAARGREDLADHPVYYDAARPDLPAVEPGALVVCELPASTCPIAASDQRWTLIATGTQPDASVSHQVYLRNR